MASSEFRPPVRSSVLRAVLGVILPLITIVPLVALGFVLVAKPASFTIGAGALVVKSGDLFSGDRTVALADVTETRAVTLKGARRIAGTAMPGFCAGRFAYPDLGDVWQVTDCGGHGVIVRARGQERPIVVSPPDPAQFVEDLRAGTGRTVTLPPPSANPVRTLLFLLAPVGILAGLMLGALLLIGPSRMVYRVADGALEVVTLFGRQSWPTAGGHAKACTPSRVWRVAGVAAPGYYTGRFRESGEATRVYATDLERVVLFEGPGVRVLVSPEDRVGFLRALEEQGAAVIHHA